MFLCKETRDSFWNRDGPLPLLAAGGGVAQLVEQRTENPCVASSILALTTYL